MVVLEPKKDERKTMNEAYLIGHNNDEVTKCYVEEVVTAHKKCNNDSVTCKSICVNVNLV